MTLDELEKENASLRHDLDVVNAATMEVVTENARLREALNKIFKIANREIDTPGQLAGDLCEILYIAQQAKKVLEGEKGE